MSRADAPACCSTDAGLQPADEEIRAGPVKRTDAQLRDVEIGMLMV